MDRRNRPALEDSGQRRAMPVVQPRRLSRSFAIDQPFRSIGVELHHPIANHLQSDAADLRRLGARGPVVDRRKSQLSSRLRTVLRSFRRRPKRARVIVIPNTNRCRHGEPSSVRSAESKIQPIRESCLNEDWYETALQENARSLIVEGIATANFDFVSLDEPNQIGEATITGALAFGNADDPVAK